MEDLEKDGREIEREELLFHLRELQGAFSFLGKSAEHGYKDPVPFVDTVRLLCAEKVTDINQIFQDLEGQTCAG